MDGVEMDAVNKLSTEITSLQKLFAGEQTSQDSPSVQSGNGQSDSAWKSTEEKKELDGHIHNPLKGNDDEVVYGRKIKGQNQAGQLSDYFSTVEERFEYLENEIRSLKATLRSSVRLSAQGEESMRPEQRPTSTGNAPGIPSPERMGMTSIHQEHGPAFAGNVAEILEIKRMREKDFYLDHPHVLQVMVGDISSPLRSNMQNNLFEKTTLPQTVPLRLRIRSRPLLRVLERMTDYTLLKDDEQQSLVFRYPYKPIIALAPGIRELSTQMSTQRSQGEPKNTGELSIASDQQILGSAEAGTEGKIIESSHGKSESVNDSDTSTVLRSEKNHTRNSLMAHFRVNDQRKPVSTRTEDDTLLEHLRLFIEFLDNDLGLQMVLYRQVNAGSLSHIAFADLWYLFNLGQEVVSHDESEQVFRVISYNHAPLSTGSAANNLPEARILRFLVTCVYFDFDGDQYGPIKKIFTIPEYEGTQPVTKLPIFPLACYSDGDYLRRLTVKRGNEFIDLTSQHTVAHRMYFGLTLDTPQREVESEIIIDFRMAHLEGFPHVPKIGTDESLRDDTPGTIKPLQLHCRCPVCVTKPLSGAEEFSGLENEARFLESNKDLVQTKTNIKPNEYTWALLLPKRLIAFTLRDRKWAMLDIGSVSQVVQTDPFRWLVLPKSHRKMLEGMVKAHSREQSSAIEPELIRGKSQGLIMLLHGAPGVGKSSSAEAAAAAAGRPLFAITPAEVGSTAVEVEANLVRHFHLAETWGCVLLIDEADVFLASRTKTDINRNALVSVFLRTVEYFSGILFLTTNRVGSIDEAFKSRIHVSLYYPALDYNSTMKVWKLNLKRVAEQTRLSVDFDGILAYAYELYDIQRKKSHAWNGRQIRNAVQTAVALAEFDSLSEPIAELSVRHIVSVADSSNQFEDYLTATLGGATNSDIAAREMLRSDDFRDDNDGHSLPKRLKADRIQAKSHKNPFREFGLREQRSQTESNRTALDDLSDDDDDDSEIDVPLITPRAGKGKRDTIYRSRPL